jgi:hypothetical protein
MDCLDIVACGLLYWTPERIVYAYEPVDNKSLKGEEQHSDHRKFCEIMIGALKTQFSVKDMNNLSPLAFCIHLRYTHLIVSVSNTLSLFLTA